MKQAKDNHVWYNIVLYYGTIVYLAEGPDMPAAEGAVWEMSFHSRVARLSLCIALLYTNPEVPPNR